MADLPDPILLERLETLAVKVRLASSSASVLRLEEVWPGTEEQFLELAGAETASEFSDIELIRDGGSTYLYSDRHMTSRYAEVVVQAQCNDIQRIIATTVRSDSMTYPRPTAVEAFFEPPFLLSHEVLTAAVDQLSADSRYSDILSVRASDGSLFLFSSDYLNQAHAESLAEWIAVGHIQNP